MVLTLTQNLTITVKPQLFTLLETPTQKTKIDLCYTLARPT